MSDAVQCNCKCCQAWSKANTNLKIEIAKWGEDAFACRKEIKRLEQVNHSLALEFEPLRTELADVKERLAWEELGALGRNKARKEGKVPPWQK